MENVSTDISRFKVGDHVIVMAPGAHFGKSGEIVERAQEAVRNRVDWCVMTRGNDGGGFKENELMPDPRFAQADARKPTATRRATSDAHS